MNDTHDQNFDANLRALGRHVQLPPAPRPEEIAAFRAGHAPGEQPPLRLAGESSPERRRPRSRWLALGSAMAACVAIGAVVFTFATGSRVEASTILADLRARQISGVNLTFNRLSAEGVTLDGVVQMRMRRPIAVDQMADDDHAWKSGDFGAIHANMHIVTSPEVDGLPNADLSAEIAFTPEVGWVFVKASNETIDQVVGAAPEAAVFANMARNGLILNIGKLDTDLLEQLGLGEAEELEAAREQAQQARDAHAKRTVSVRAGANTSGAGLGISIDGQPRTASEAGIESIARSMLSGKARQQELDQLKSYLISANQHATVRNLGGGRYELVADLHDDDAEPGAPSKATLTLNYEEQDGVQWAELSGMERTTGSIRFEFASDPIDPAMLDYQRLVKVGETNYIDVRSMLKLLGPAMGGGE